MRGGGAAAAAAVALSCRSWPAALPSRTQQPPALLEHAGHQCCLLHKTWTRAKQVYVELALLPQLQEALFLTVFAGRNKYAFSRRLALLEHASYECSMLHEILSCAIQV